MTTGTGRPAETASLNSCFPGLRRTIRATANRPYVAKRYSVCKKHWGRLDEPFTLLCWVREGCAQEANGIRRDDDFLALVGCDHLEEPKTSNTGFRRAMRRATDVVAVTTTRIEKKFTHVGQNSFEHLFKSFWWNPISCYASLKVGGIGQWGALAQWGRFVG